MTRFDPYYKWLGIPSKEQPPNHYRLLGIELFETDREVIDAASDRQMSYIRRCAGGEHLHDSQKILSELAQARLCLLNPQRKAEYDAGLRERQSSAAAAIRPIDTADATFPEFSPRQDAPPPLLNRWRPTRRGPISEFWTGLGPGSRKLAVGASVAVMLVLLATFSGRAKPPQGNELTKSSELAQGEPTQRTPPKARGVKPAAPSTASSSNPLATTADLPQPTAALPGSAAHTTRPSLPPSQEVSPDTAPLAPATIAEKFGAILYESKASVSAERVGNPEPASPPDTFANSVGMKLKRIPAGEFTMGSPESEPQRGYAEAQHRVAISRPFYLGIYEVSQAEFERVMGCNPSYFAPGGEGEQQLQGQDHRRLPVDSITAELADAFCERLSARPEEQQQQRFYRLPTEAEWEYACRAGTTTPYAFGDTLNKTQAFFGGSMSSVDDLPKCTMPVDSFKPNAWGLFNMHGNMLELCADYAGPESPLGKGVDVDPFGPPIGTALRARGGGWRTSRVQELRSAARGIANVNTYSETVGLRVACDLGAPRGPKRGLPVVSSRVPVLSSSVLRVGQPLQVKKFKTWWGCEVVNGDRITVHFSGSDAYWDEDVHRSDLQFVVDQSLMPQAAGNTSAPPKVPAAAASPGQPIVNSIGMTLRPIPAGEFLMGSPLCEQSRRVSEIQHRVRLPRAFFMGAYEVSEGEYQRVMGKLPEAHAPPPRRDGVGGDAPRGPVTGLTWDDAESFCQTLSLLSEERKARRVYRLPTEAEWEYACRAGTTTPYSWGGTGSGARHSGQPNAWGLFRMHDNVREICADWSTSTFGRHPDEVRDDPQGNPYGFDHAVRGDGRSATSASEGSGGYKGMRVVCELAPPAVRRRRRSVETSGPPVLPATPLSIGQPLQVKIGSATWYVCEVADLYNDGSVKVHFPGFDQDDDHRVQRNDLQLAPAPANTAP